METISVPQLRNLLKQENLENLPPFLAKLLEQKLEAKEKKAFARQIVSFLDKKVIPAANEELFSQLIHFLHKFFSKNEGYEIARLYYDYGRVSHKGRFFIYAGHAISAIDKPKAAVYHLWGKILHATGLYTEKYDHFERSIEKYERTLKLKGESFELLWDLAKVWRDLGEYSTEDYDFSQAVFYFRKAYLLGEQSSCFLLDFGRALCTLAHHKGDLHYLYEARDLLKPLLLHEEESEAWVLYAKIHVRIYEYSTLSADFELAAQLFEQAITAAPERGELWLEWGELYLRSGINNRSLKDLENAIEKLTSLKSKEVSPVRLAAAIGKALAAIGVLLDDYTLLCEGKRRVLTALELVPESAHLLISMGYIYYAHGLYFGEVKEFERAAQLFGNLLKKDNSDPDLWFALFQATLCQATVSQNSALLAECLKMIKRVVALRPQATLYLRNYATILLALAKTDGEVGALLQQALGKCKKALSLNEEFETLLLYAVILDLYGSFAQDESYFEKAIQILRALYQRLPTDMRVCYQLGVTLFHFGEITKQIGEIEEAIALLEQAATRDVENEELLGALGYAKLLLSEMVDDPALPQLCQSLKSESEALLLQASQMGNGQAYYHLACLYSLTGHHDKAMQALFRAESNHALPPIGTLEHEPLLHRLSETSVFQEYLKSKKEHEHG